MERKFRLISALECTLECVNESTPVPYWPQFCEFDLSIGRNKLYVLASYFNKVKTISTTSNCPNCKIQGNKKSSL